MNKKVWEKIATLENVKHQEMIPMAQPPKKRKKKKVSDEIEIEINSD